MKKSRDIYGRYIGIWLCAVCLCMGAIVAFNLFIDPYWMTGCANRFNRIQRTIDERLQKSNFLAFNGMREGYNAVLLGSSRGTYLDAAHIKTQKVFNYSSNSLIPVEYPAYAAFFQAHAGKVDTIYLAVDFFGTRPPDHYEYRSPDDYDLDSIGRLPRTVSLLLSFDCLKYSRKVLKLNSGREKRKVGDYDKETRNHIDPPQSAEQRKLALIRQLEFYRTRIYGGDYVYNSSIDQAFEQLKKGFPDADFVVFTTPPTLVLQSLLVDCGRVADYEHWIRVLVKTFGRVYDFMGENTITSNPENYRDAHHLLPVAGNRILGDITCESPEIAAIVVPENLEEHLVQQRKIFEINKNLHREFTDE